MIKHICDRKTGELCHIEEGEPECGEYCDHCGDCLSCYGEEKCRESTTGEHFWVEYRLSEKN